MAQAVSWRAAVETWAASFRGVPFRARSTEAEGGKRLARWDIPQRELPLFEDLGRKARTFGVEAHLVGEDYLEQKERLLQALEEEGHGRLILPWWGTVTATGIGWRVLEENAEGRICRMALGFVESKRTEPEPAAPPSLRRGEVDAAATALEDAAGAELAENLDATSVPRSFREATWTAVQGLGDLLDDLDVARGAAREVSEFGRTVRDLVNAAVGLATSPADLALEIVSTTRELGQLLEEAPAAAAAAYQALFGFDRPTPYGQAPGASANAALVVGLVRAAALAGLARALARRRFLSYPEAAAARDGFLEALDAFAADAADEVYQALDALASALAAAVPAEGQGLPVLETREVLHARPSLALAWEFYADLDRAAEIEDRNGVRNPLFVAGELEVLVDA